MKTIALLVLLVPAHALASAPAVNVRDFGAIGNGTTDDSLAIQRALDAGAGGQVFFPMGTYLVTGIPNGFWCLKVSPGTELRGEDRARTTLVEAPNQAASVQLLWIENAPDVSITNLTLDGANGSQTVNPQRHGMFTKNSPRLSLRHVTSQHFTGDGITGAGIARTNEAGMFIRTTRVEEPMESVIVQRNTISNFANYGLGLGGNGAAVIKKVDITGNTFSDTSPVPTMLTALFLNDGLDEALDVTVGSNTLSGGTTTLITHPPGGTPTAISGTRWVMP